ncbi:MAG: D-2-hydroxyacid dehydrogenase [Mesorhizobium sp.]|uniref:D-2-hydroxyacid dehydrogenase n=1 Tax=unclassified Mesorhizobium TaxID=325217 RepID=UPI000FCB1EB6|nr:MULTISPECIES: D-2-hydroxyacid dehydrogenase [unclassified Mesorhizobium]RUV44968.1 D-2-hydroxyacid dehydrogenase [Mesorhizobium sp. M1A.T.Ca.IN.004.03.1.1]RWG20564.1 MAG: D-2-hydroxyacid dehydrogenase [Mesorhizobium sp.]RWI99481.1 MAG: D-2-hydroxyacid dehydrogenase [Mesorhizobium sp.]RWK40159.1 MAG: D-2-hydroxyacid dehydrogenase [Mesorhizobium sp.]RWK90627.1 MAG: D-2-hydroxyacid dehydrogenase [Mesorhizobium sp.]
MSARPTIIVSSDAPDGPIAVLAETHPDIRVLGCDSYEALPDLIADTGAEVVFTIKFDRGSYYPRAALVESPTVRWVSVGGSGTDHLRPWDPTKVTITNSAGVAADMMAEYVFGAMLSFSLGLRGFAREQAARSWTAGKVEPIQGKTLLILGLGKTGQAVAARARAFGMTTLGVRARPKPTDHIDEVHGMADLPRLWGRADFILCAVPLLESTRGIVGSEAFAAMKPSAVLIDVSRGGVVDEAALLAALDGGRIKGAALDVFAVEPLPPAHPLWGYENVIVTPHCSSVYDGWDVKSARMFAENLARYRRGEPLANVVDPGRGY